MTLTTGLPHCHLKHSANVCQIPGSRRSKGLHPLQQNFKRKPEMQKQYVAFMKNIFINGHAEVAPLLTKDKDYWYLLSFRVYHSQKPNQKRVVFDSSAQCTSISLNDVLFTGLDSNSFLRVLLYFQKERVHPTNVSLFFAAQRPPQLPLFIMAQRQ